MTQRTQKEKQIARLVKAVKGFITEDDEVTVDYLRWVFFAEFELMVKHGLAEGMTPIESGKAWNELVWFYDIDDTEVQS